MDSFIVCCPSCFQYIEIEKINCGVFRCGVYKSDGKQIDPHLPQEECEKLVLDGLIYGCGKPFRITSKFEEPIVCSYDESH